MHKFIAFIFCFSFLNLFGQSYSSNPYSASGLGDEGSLGEATFVGVGGIKSVLVDSTLVNFYNPSSYSFLAHGQPLMSVNVSGRISRMSEGNLSQKSGVGNISHITLAFPVTRKFGFAAGLTPFSRKGYSLSTTQAVYGDSVTYLYRGTGTTQRVFTGVSYKFLDTRKTKFAIGANLAYIFGTVSNERYSGFKSVSVAGLDENVIRMHSLYYDIGFTYKQFLDSAGRNSLTLAATVVPQQSLSASKDYGLYSTGGTSFERNKIIDTLVYNANQKGTISYPSTITLGAAYYYSPSNSDGHLKHVYQVGVLAEFSHTNWSKYNESFAEHTSPVYADGSRFSIGFTYRPSIVLGSKAAGGTFLNRMQYKTGFYSQTMPVQTSNGQLKETAFTLGFGIPIPVVKNNSNFNVGISAGNRSNGTAFGLSEKFLTFSVGIILSPSKNDQWFRRYKLD